ncbi:sigma-70 family RNA polymerase sigma factor [Aeoliella sp. ICT_H6.2]|uniref:Sigma-70 family RNA polymerase sigma factor n=1 Tax=Aeoliella straminimaris TaxID=2954799 RepID=A0A9X2FFK6_9BACT|nr:sigma-70 family RNA polymerase sigma factor [Aeoliella straminimaris]MCO6047092.1 sigma-70 family RNA polymerase sigma factor [Aeoliella straminimaris]
MPQSQAISAGQFVQLVVKYEWRFRGFVATMLASTSDIDEVVQNSLLVAWEKLGEFSYTDETPDESFVRWVCTIARYQSLRLHQQRVGTSLIFDDALIERLTATQLEEAPLLEVQRTALKGCIEKLVSDDKDLVQRRYTSGQTVEELATWTGKTKSAVYKSLKRIRNVLMRCIEQTTRQEGF